MTTRIKDDMDTYEEEYIWTPDEMWLPMSTHPCVLVAMAAAKNEVTLILHLFLVCQPLPITHVLMWANHLLLCDCWMCRPCTTLNTMTSGRMHKNCVVSQTGQTVYRFILFLHTTQSALHSTAVDTCDWLIDWDEHNVPFSTTKAIITWISWSLFYLRNSGEANTVSTSPE